MKKPRRRRAAPRVRQVRGLRFVLHRYQGGWSAACRYTDAAGVGHRFGVACPAGHPAWRSPRRGLLSALHELAAQERGRP